MRIAREVEDLTARARIRDAAIECFARDGFAASFRTIAAQAGVSAGLITHHFGSKGALREECDAEVLRRYRDIKTDAVDQPSAHLIGELTRPSGSPTILVYLIRAVGAGGAGAQRFLDRLMDDMRDVMARGVASGLVRPSRDEEARLRYLTYQTMGALLVQFLATEHATPEEFVATLSGVAGGDVVLPMLELASEGYLADGSLLDEYVRFLAEPSDDQDASAS